MVPSPSRLASKYRYALRGAAVASRTEDSFRVHLPVAAAVVIVAVWLRVSLIEGVLLTLCVAAVIAAELFNTSIERLARAITTEQDPHVRDALDVAAAGVLVVAVAAKIVGTVIFASRLLAGG